MFQKIIIGVLTITIIGAIGVGIYDATRSAEDTPAVATNEEVVDEVDMANEVAVVQPKAASETIIEEPVVVPEYSPNQANVNPEATPEITVGEPQQQSVDNVGAVWTGSGVITELTDIGMTLKLDNGGTTFVELGPPTYWQGLDKALIVGEYVTVQGFDNGANIHTQTLKSASGFELAFRTETGQPLWSGGATDAGQGNGNTAGAGETQVAPDEWVTLNGIIVLSSNGNVTIETETGEQVQLQLGQSRFWQGQGITFEIGDALSVLGYWQGDRFQTGEIIKTATGERLMLRDPNGRPLWAGPGNNGNNGNGNGGNGNGGNGNGGNGNGGSGS